MAQMSQIRKMQFLPQRHGDTEARRRPSAPPCLRASVVILLFFSMTAAAQKLVEVPLTEVKLTDQFWSPKLQTNRTITVWHNFRECEQTGRIANFERAATGQKGGHKGFFFNDSDVYKVIEGASYILAAEKDEKLDKYVDELIA